MTLLPSLTSSSLSRMYTFGKALLGILAIAIFVAPILYLAFFRGDTIDVTFGHIHVDSPTVYTRERLVNDRFVEDAWLRTQLESSNIQEFKAEFVGRTVHSKRLATTGGPPSQSPPPASTTPEKTAAQAEGANEAAGETGLRLTPIDRLNAELHYREQIRNLIIENQLDDRHDLKGNTLYRLRFPATIIPGNRSVHPAVVTIKIAKVGNHPNLVARKRIGSLHSIESDERAKWEELYEGWLNSIELRLNQARLDILRAYNEMNFPSNYYEDLLRQIQQTFGVHQSNGVTESELLRARRNLDYGTPEEAREAHLTYQRAISGSFSAQRAISKKGKKPEERPGTSIATDSREIPSLELELERFLERKAYDLIIGRYLYGFQQDGVPTISTFAHLTREAPQAGKFSVRPLFWKVEIVPDDNPKGVDTAIIKTASGDVRINNSQYQSVKQLGFEIHDSERIELKNVGSWFDVRIGLLSFIRALDQREEIYTYSVTPREASHRLLSNSSLNDDVQLSSSFGAEKAGIAALLRVGDNTSTSFKGITVQPLVVGFGHYSLRGNADFGWLIGPQMDETGRLRHVPKQHQLTALVSVPSWWSSLTVEVKTHWIGESGYPVDLKHATKDIKYSVELPVDYESLESILLGSDRGGPEVLESRMERVVLSVCQEASILIPGKRLWRSSVVTLGGQRADSISVLPDMKGIIARFRQVERPSGWVNLDREYYAPLTIWTSQGNITMSQRAKMVASQAMIKQLSGSSSCTVPTISSIAVVPVPGGPSRPAAGRDGSR